MENLRGKLNLKSVFFDHGVFVANNLRRFGVLPADVADQTQEVFLVVHALQDDYDTSRPLRPWLFGIAYRVAARYRKKSMQLERADRAVDIVQGHAAAALPDEELEARQRRELVVRALERVDFSRRAVFVLSEIEGFGVPEVAESLQIPLNTAYSRLRLARAEFTEAVRVLSARKGASK